MVHTVHTKQRQTGQEGGEGCERETDGQTDREGGLGGGSHGVCFVMPK